jgi:hypothetical protein
MSNKITPGRYTHYKGGEYEVLGEVVHSESLAPMVLYKALYDSPDFPANTLWVRPKNMFLEAIMIEGEKRPRFTFKNFKE